MIRFKHTPKFSEFWALNRAVVLKQMGILKWFAGLLLIAFVTLPWQPAFKHQGKSVWEIYAGSLAVLILPAILAFMFVSAYWAARKRWDSSLEVRCTREYEIGPNGIQIRGDGIDGFMEWKHTTKAECINGLFVITTGQRLVYYFPITAVPDGVVLRALLRERIPAAKV